MIESLFLHRKCMKRQKNKGFINYVVYFWLLYISELKETLKKFSNTKKFYFYGYASQSNVDTDSLMKFLVCFCKTSLNT